MSNPDTPDAGPKTAQEDAQAGPIPVPALPTTSHMVFVVNGLPYHLDVPIVQVMRPDGQPSIFAIGPPCGFCGSLLHRFPDHDYAERHPEERQRYVSLQNVAAMNHIQQQRQLGLIPAAIPPPIPPPVPIPYRRPDDKEHYSWSKQCRGTPSDVIGWSELKCAVPHCHSHWHRTAEHKYATEVLHEVERQAEQFSEYAPTGPGSHFKPKHLLVSGDEGYVPPYYSQEYEEEYEEEDEEEDYSEEYPDEPLLHQDDGYCQCGLPLDNPETQSESVGDKRTASSINCHNPFCGNCGKPGHKTGDCYYICSLCGEHGHYEPKCRKKNKRLREKQYGNGHNGGNGPSNGPHGNGHNQQPPHGGSQAMSAK